MKKAGPFEPCPHLAVALSGGADSMALLHLCRSWAAEKYGRVTALIVDHGLRTESAAEARLVQQRARVLGVSCQILRWDGAKPATAIQAAARTARYDLLGAWCRKHNVLHLMLGHHRDDQAETILLRKDRDSGPDGLAGMSLIRETGWGRLIRPLLPVERGRLRATVRKAGLEWVEDPSNQNEAFARVRARRALSESGPDLAGRLIAEAQRSAAIRTENEAADAAGLARAVTIYPEGYARLSVATFSQESPAVKARMLGRLIACLGGRSRPPKREALARLSDAMAKDRNWAGATLGGSRLIHDHDDILILRETGRCRPEMIREGQKFLWDGRFTLTLPRRTSMKARRLRIAPLGSADQAALGGVFDKIERDQRHTRQILRSFPALFDHHGLVAVPHLGYGRHSRYASLAKTKVTFTPEIGLSDAGFVVV